MVCYVHIKEEDDRPSEKVKAELTRHGSITSRGVLNMLKSKAVVRCNESYYLTGKISSSADIGKSFCVQMVDKFLAATLSNQHGPAIRLQKWNKNDVAASDKNDASEQGNGTEDETDHSIPKLSKLESFTNMLKRSSVGKEEGEPIRNGDFVVLECDGK